MKIYKRITQAAALIVCGVFAAPLHAQSCDTAPLFDLAGGMCSAGRQGEQCGCSECLAWDPAGGATWYQILRCDGDGKNCMVVGDTRWRNHAAYTDADGKAHAAVQPTLWCAAWDAPFPEVGAAYAYTVRACADGASGPVCSLQPSNAVGYVGAPYMCIEQGLEIPCGMATPPPSALPTDLNGDGVTDAIDPDDDGDGIPDAIDNCPRVRNIGQRDADHDGVGDACDSTPRSAGTGLSDADRDGIADRVDNCPAVYNPLQTDTDHDRTGDDCDNCPSVFNEAQIDTDGDGEGDRCDADDGTIYVAWESRTRFSWTRETGPSTWCVYRGDLAELRRSQTYTQRLGSNPLALRTCGVSAVFVDDAVLPSPGATAFYLVAGRPGLPSAELGSDSAGFVRPNANPCP
jgi:hypothetical protein